MRHCGGRFEASKGGVPVRLFKQRSQEEKAAESDVGALMKVISTALAVAALAAGAAPAAADPGARGTPFQERPSYHSSPHESDVDGTTAMLILGGVLLFVVIGGPLFGAESRPAWRNVDGRPDFRMVGSMRPEDWPPSEFKR
jgi:hypothetical protein